MRIHVRFPWLGVTCFYRISARSGVSFPLRDPQAAKNGRAGFSYRHRERDGVVMGGKLLCPQALWMTPRYSFARRRLISMEIIGQKNMIRASVIIVPTKALDQNTPSEPLARIID